MQPVTVTGINIEAFAHHLYTEEKSPATIEKYLRDVHTFLTFLRNEPVSRETLITFKAHLQSAGYAVRSINSILAAVNAYLSYLGRPDLRAKQIRWQRQTYCAESRELTRAEYLRLLRAAERKPRLWLILQTICGTGIRVSELRYFTVSAVQRGEVSINCKSKTRTILIPGKLRQQLLLYARQHGIAEGVIFVTTGGRPLDRSNIWAQMKQLCAGANVSSSKVFPHNLRKLFARTYYGNEKDIAKLADILGHSSIETTRIYIMTTGCEHRRQIERLGLVI